MPTSPRATYTPDEARKIVGVGRDVFYQMLKAGAVPAHRAGRRYIISKRAFHRWLDGGPDETESR